jgi:hypothetical protein
MRKLKGAPQRRWSKSTEVFTILINLLHSIHSDFVIENSTSKQTNKQTNHLPISYKSEGSIPLTQKSVIGPDAEHVISNQHNVLLTSLVRLTQQNVVKLSILPRVTY